MMKSLLASKTAKLVAACVCPVAGTATLGVTVPQVRTAIHKATAPAKPRAYAAPKTRVRTSPFAAPCDEGQIPMGTPLAFAVPPQVPAASSGTDITSTPPVRLAGTGGSRPQVPIDLGRPGNTVTPAVPETATWMQMIVGFGLVGGALRGSAYALQVRQA
jgi:hypothetical protein